MDARKRHQLEHRRKRLLKTRARAENSRMTSTSGAGSCGDRGEGYKPPTRKKSSIQHDKELLDWYENAWEAKKIVNIPVEDMLREGWEYEGLQPEQTELLITLQDELNVITALEQVMRLERLFGGAVIFMGVADGVDGKDDPSKPIDHSSLNVGSLKWLNVIPRIRVKNAEFDKDPLSPNYGRPERYNINGQPVHRSRLLIFDGSPLTPTGTAELASSRFNNRNDGFGNSVLDPLINDLTNAVGTRQGAFNLVNMASIWLLKTDIAALEETETGKARLEELGNLAQQISMYRAAMLDNGDGNTDLSSVSPSFGGVPELVISFLQVLAAAADIPATRYIGQAPGGLNATGESDLENWYNSVESKQQQRLLPQLIKLLKVMGPSALGQSFDIRDVVIEFNPLWNLSGVEESTVRTNDSNNIVNLVNSGVISSTEGEREARERGILISTPVENDLLPEEELPTVDDALNQLRGPTDAVDSIL